MSLRDDLKLLKLSVKDLAGELGMEYGHCFTAVGFLEKGEEPTRKSVKERMAQITEHVETLKKVSVKQTDADADPKRKAEFWDSPTVAVKRYPTPAGTEAVFEYKNVVFGQLCGIDLDPNGGTGRFRFFRVIVREGKEPYADMFDVDTGALRSVRLHELDEGKR